jgi:hypothetical protein
MRKRLVSVALSDLEILYAPNENQLIPKVTVNQKELLEN